MKNLLFVSIVVFLFSSNALFQTTSTPKEEDVQSWNDVQTTVPLDKKTDFILTGTLRFGENVQKLIDRRIAIAFNYKITHWLAVQPGYTNIVSTPRVGNRTVENRLSFAATYKFPFKKLTLTDRNLFERRLRSPENSTRYRNRLQLEIPLKKFYDTRFFSSDEIFYDWNLKRWSRNRLIVGLGKNFTKNFGLDVFYMRQNDSASRPGDLNVTGTTFKIQPSKKAEKYQRLSAGVVEEVNFVGAFERVIVRLHLTNEQPVIVTRPKTETLAFPLKPGQEVTAGLVRFRVIPNFTLSSERASKMV